MIPGRDDHGVALHTVWQGRQKERDDFKVNGGKTSRNESVGFGYTILDIF